MKKSLVSRRIATTFGTLALVALMTAGAATAGSMITSAQIKNETITNKDVKNGSLGVAELTANARTALASEASSGGFAPVVGNVNNVAEGTSASVTLTCPAGKAYAGGGGWFYVDTDNDNTFDAGETIVTDASINGIVWNNASEVVIRATHNVVGAQGDFFGWIHCATA
jgi:hypothetical protein